MGWFTGEHIDGSILAMLVISEAYEALRLYFASRYYRAGALFTALNQEDDRLLVRVEQAIFRLTETFFAAGEGLTTSTIQEQRFGHTPPVLLPMPMIGQNIRKCSGALSTPRYTARLRVG